MKYLKGFNIINESAESSARAEMISRIKDFINRGLLPDKEFLDDCFIDLIDAGAICHYHNSNIIYNNIMDRYLITERDYKDLPFTWCIDYRMDTNKVIYNVNGKKEVDDIDKFKIFVDLKDNIERVRSEYPNYTIEVEFEDGRLVIEINTLNKIDQLCKEVGFTNKKSSVDNFWNPLNYLWNEIKKEFGI